MALPGVGFEPVRYESRRAEKTGNLLIDGNTCAAGPPIHGRMLTVGLRHDVVQILDEHSEPVLSLERVFGRQAKRILDRKSVV